jgi:hypothetical protein
VLRPELFAGTAQVNGAPLEIAKLPCSGSKELIPPYRPLAQSKLLTESSKHQYNSVMNEELNERTIDQLKADTLVIEADALALTRTILAHEADSDACKEKFSSIEERAEDLRQTVQALIKEKQASKFDLEDVQEKLQVIEDARSALALLGD